MSDRDHPKDAPPPQDSSDEMTQEITQPPSALGERYDLLGELGRGGMGVVYKARDRETEDIVALKVLKPEIAARPDVIGRFKSELRLARKVTHKNVCRIHELLRFGDTVAIAMEYVEGESLRAFLERFGTVPLRRGIEWIKQICSVLAEAHGQGIVHRDLKPENIMIDKRGRAKVMDFGIARSFEGETATGTGTIIGTPAYMSPEQAEGKPADPRSDIYSLGLTMYEMFAGQPAFEADTPVALAFKQVHEPPRRPRDLEPSMPPAVEKAILRCVEKNPVNRFQTVEELEAELTGGSTSGVWMRVGRLLPKLRTRRWELVAGLAAAGLLASTIAILFMRQEARPPGPGETLPSSATPALRDTKSQEDLGQRPEPKEGVPEEGPEAVKWFRQAAQRGHADAQYRLGVMYANGQGVPRDYPQAAFWFRKAAAQGHPSAQSTLGIMYFLGEGVHRDYREALNWLQKAAQQGDPAAEYTLGIMYFSGQGVRKDDREAARWFTKAADQGYPEAQYMLGVMYQKGQGVPQDDVEGRRWIRTATDRAMGKPAPPTTTGILAGTFRDEKGAPMASATVEVRHPYSGRTYTGSTDENGYYRIPELAPGVYEVTADRTGFQPERHIQVRISVNRVTVEDFVLRAKKK
jgi:predicted Ser/Thr protein kinase